MRTWAVLACAGLCSCATLDRAPVRAPDPQAVSERSYRIGAEQTANLGDSLVRVRNYRLATAPAAEVRADRDFTLAGGLDRLHFKAGETLPVVGRRRAADGATLLVVNKDDSFLVQVREADGRIEPRVLNELGFGVRTPMLARFHPRPAEARLMPVQRRSVEEKSFGDNYDLLFSGADERSLHLTLREYWRDDLDRPALQQTLTFPVAAGVIHFRGLSVGIRDAKPDRLTYVVQSDGAGALAARGGGG